MLIRAAVHEHLGQLAKPGDRVEHQGRSPWIGNVVRDIGLVEGYHGVRPIKVLQHVGYLCIDLKQRDLLDSLKL